MNAIRWTLVGILAILLLAACGTSTPDVTLSPTLDLAKTAAAEAEGTAAAVCATLVSASSSAAGPVEPKLHAQSTMIAAIAAMIFSICPT